MAGWQSDEGEPPPGEEDEEELEGEWELDPNDPTHPDYDLSVAAGYASWEPAPKSLFVRRGVVLIVSLVLVIALLVPLCARLT